jgi:two-component system, OmpR family, response regulator
MSINNVLLVDDDANIRMVTQMALEDVAGWNVIAVSSGEDALKTLAEAQPHVILLDMMMPGMDGVTTFGRIKSDGFGNIPVIFLTAKVQPSEIEQYVAQGAAGVIIKPFDPMKLANEIRRILQK